MWLHERARLIHEVLRGVIALLKEEPHADVTKGGDRLIRARRRHQNLKPLELIEACPRLKRRASRGLRELNAVARGFTAYQARDRGVLTPRALINPLINALLRVRLRQRVDDQLEVSAGGALLSVTEEHLSRARLP
jgi:hypothetical protein